MLASNLKSLRAKTGQTQEQVAAILNISRPSYSRYETGERAPDFEILTRMAEHFKVSIDFLLGNKQEGIIDTARKRIRSLIHMPYEAITDQTPDEVAYWYSVVNAEIPLTIEMVNKFANDHEVSIEFLLGITEKPQPQPLLSEKTPAEKLGDALMQAFIDAGKLKPGEPLTEELRQYAEDLVRTALAVKQNTKSKGGSYG